MMSSWAAQPIVQRLRDKPFLAQLPQLLSQLPPDGRNGVTNPHDPLGCLTVRGALASGEEADPIRLELALRRSESEALIRKRFEQAKRDGELPPGANPADLARNLATVYQGMSVQAAGGATRGQLRRVAETALRAWPTQWPMISIRRRGQQDYDDSSREVGGRSWFHIRRFRVPRVTIRRPCLLRIYLRSA